MTTHDRPRGVASALPCAQAAFARMSPSSQGWQHAWGAHVPIDCSVCGSLLPSSFAQTPNS
eukprot:4733706-Pyramimonas_sp.AAC.1